MASLEDEIRDLKEQNSELVQEVQHWKCTAAQKEKEKLELMKDINELRLKLSRLRSGGAAEARKLDTALQVASEEALSHLVQASGAVARTIDLAKQYMRDRQEMETSSPRWSSISGTPNSDKVNRVPPLLMGGQSIQPVVSLSRNLTNLGVSRTRNLAQNPNITVRAVPVSHMLQDVYIPLTRIDLADLPSNTDAETENSADLGLGDDNEQAVDESDMTDDFESSSRGENPLEGPSWLLDVAASTPSRPATSLNLEPDSTTPGNDVELRTDALAADHESERENAVVSVRLSFTPTVRRRRRPASPPPEPPPSAGASRDYQNSGRILKVMVAKMRMANEQDGGDASPPKRAALNISPPQAESRRPTLEDTRPEELSERLTSTRSTDSLERVLESPTRSSVRDVTPPKRLMRFDAPSPNGATDSGLFVFETPTEPIASGSGLQRESRPESRASSRANSVEPGAGGDGDGESRTRRPRKNVTYKEKPLNRKLRR